jgi:Holliday junction resolvase
MYARGNYAERRTADTLRGDGYAVWQSRGSKGPADLIAVKVGEILLVQVKSGTTPIGGSQWNALYQLARQIGAVPVVADWPKRGKLRLRRITGEHLERKQTWPAIPFTLDQIDAAIQRHPAGGR